MATDVVLPEPPRQSRCFACGAQNPRGLQLNFQSCEDHSVAAAWTPAPEFEGFPGIIHGGIVATVLDEAMSKAVAARGWRALTCELNIRLRHTVHSGQPHHVRARISSRRKRCIMTEAVLLDAHGSECARASATFLAPPESGRS